MSDQTIHENQPMLTHGAALSDATVAVLLMHGRGATAEDILHYAKSLPTDGVAYLMPQASQNRWYPNSGFAPFEVNEPDLGSAWHTIELKLQQIQDAGIPLERIVIGGFSQGACLTSEFVARNARRYGGLICWSGALMGDDNTSRDYKGSLDGTPVWVGGANQDKWMVEQQLHNTASVLKGLGGDVAIKVHDSAKHMVRPADIENATRIINAAKSQ